MKTGIAIMAALMAAPVAALATPECEQQGEMAGIVVEAVQAGDSTEDAADLLQTDFDLTHEEALSMAETAVLAHQDTGKGPGGIARVAERACVEGSKRDL